MMEDAEKMLLKQAQGGDMDAFVALFEEFRPMVYRTACRLVGEGDAYDMTMTVFLKAWQSLPGFQGRSSLQTWLYRITYRAAIDSLRQRRIRQAPPTAERDGESVEREIADERQKRPDEAVADAELATHVNAALDRLSAEHRMALLLRYREDLSYLEMASVMGVSLGTVMSRLFNARRRLRKLMEEEIGEV
jgi:RNA polymerase sigma-70 factor (ECF subfamily)